MEDLKPQLDGFKKNVTTTTVDEDPGEAERREELTRYACPRFVSPQLSTVSSAH